MNRSGHQHGRGEAILGIWLALFPEKYIYIYIYMSISLFLYPSLSCNTSTLPFSTYITMVDEIEYIRSVPIHIKASEIHPFLFRPMLAFTLVPDTGN